VDDAARAQQAQRELLQARGELCPTKIAIMMMKPAKHWIFPPKMLIMVIQPPRRV